MVTKIGCVDPGFGRRVEDCRNAEHGFADRDGPACRDHHGMEDQLLHMEMQEHAEDEILSPETEYLRERGLA